MKDSHFPFAAKISLKSGVFLLIKESELKNYRKHNKDHTTEMRSSQKSISITLYEDNSLDIHKDSDKEDKNFYPLYLHFHSYKTETYYIADRLDIINNTLDNAFKVVLKTGTYVQEIQQLKVTISLEELSKKKKMK